MQKRLLLLTFLVNMAWAVPVSAQRGKGSPAGDYVVGPGDVLDISVWKDESLTRSVLVLPDGTIAFPLIGNIQAAGKTLLELKKEIETGISRYVKDPVLSLEVRQVNSMIFYVIGRVNNPGKFLLNANINVLQALAMAGGLNPFAKKGSIRILRQHGDRTESFPFNYDDVIMGKNLGQNITLQRGDVLVVP